MRLPRLTQLEAKLKVRFSILNYEAEVGLAGSSFPNQDNLMKTLQEEGLL